MVCHVLSNRVLEMGRYVKRDPDVIDSLETTAWYLSVYLMSSLGLKL